MIYFKIMLCFFKISGIPLSFHCVYITTCGFNSSNGANK